VSIQNYSRAERKQQVIQTLILRIKRGSGAEITMYKLARALGLKPSTHFTNILNEVVKEGFLWKRELVGRPDKWNTFYYSLTSDYVRNNQVVFRDVPIKTKGVHVDQMRMF